MTAVLDTSALMLPVQSDVRLFEELERLLGYADCVVPEAVVAELSDLSEGATDEARAASVGRDLAERCEAVATEAAYADDAVFEVATERPEVTHAVTTDAALAGRLLDAGVSVIRLRGQHELAVNQP